MVAVLAFFESCLVYRNLIFSNIRDNIHYFIGFFTVSLSYGIYAFGKVLGIEVKLPLMVALAVAAANLAHRLITQKIDEFKREEVQNIKDPHLAALWLTQLSQDCEKPDKV